MSGYVSVGVGAVGVATITIDAGFLVDRVANILRRPDMKNEILYWLNFAQWRLAQHPGCKFPELRTTATKIDLSANTYEYNLPSDFAQMGRVYYKATYASPAWGKHLTPLPERYTGEPIDIESQLNVPTDMQSTGDPRFYLVKNGKLWIYPAPEDIPGEIYVTYYMIPPDMPYTSSVPAINKEWRHYLIWLTLYWAKSAIEQEDPAKPLLWERKAMQTMDFIARALNRKENPREDYGETLPEIGLEDADRVF